MAVIRGMPVVKEEDAAIIAELAHELARLEFDDELLLRLSSGAWQSFDRYSAHAVLPQYQRLISRLAPPTPGDAATTEQARQDSSADTRPDTHSRRVQRQPLEEKAHG